ncbi:MULTISPECIES: alpha-L-arabinofuranosidase C-terminal domain-containing protein [Sphingobacterium]|jgi:alpha-L-arabinofuranosidase|uniref:alpha-L-arabinofuranosidase C-terminal domain-containing protein n=1 Tax=Sphingobacterium TaxID=28453 RepID=UPI00104C35E9|nr:MULTISPECIES: alpha-L-arabinofuranosidase C-terminal domain-containing protein [Sphingobacterium]MCW2263837.1 alpha-L-arabinofuranosidase [Sphingobacterium kitahiroshimense]TCR00365.1 alpha-L-arabinofuranosidase [Sphingobacterium sp. JUb78]
MKKQLIYICLLLFFVVKHAALYANEPDSAYIFAYSSGKNDHHNGLHFAWSLDKKKWTTIGAEASFLRSDYGQWGSQKKMIDPFLFLSPTGIWHCVWSLNQEDGAFAHSASRDLIQWESQSYPLVFAGGNCLSPVIDYNKTTGTYQVIWKTDRSAKGYYAVETKDFKMFSTAKKATVVHNTKVAIRLSDGNYTGTVHKVAWQILENLLKKQQLDAYKGKLNSERMVDDVQRFASLTPLKGNLKLDEHIPARKISDLLIGAFFEDINYAADGGLYAELIQNRGFEYTPMDRKEWHSLTAWRTTNRETVITIDTLSPIHENNRHYVTLQGKPGAGIVNEGFGGISIKKDEQYNFSIYARGKSGQLGHLQIRLIDGHGNTIGETKTKKLSKKWEQYKLDMVGNVTISDARLEITYSNNGAVDMDMVSLFPKNTFRNRANGLRADLAKTIADMKPRFVRFPGGCVAHGDGIDNIYHWKNTIGPVEQRKPQRNLWGYHQSFGLGYFEYFQFCEDMGAEPVPVVAAGVPCQNSGHHGHELGGQQCGIPMEDMGDYIQDVLDLIEYANGDRKTLWGKKRAEAGHPAPFNLKYIGIGNEDLITDLFKERFTLIYQAVKEKYPDIEVIGTAGPFYEGSDYVEGWDLATKLNVPLIDEHYYNPPGWFIHNQEFYDRYDRKKAKVYLGEYAAHVPNRASTIETALAEALHLCNVERNADVVTMTSYAPLLAKEGNTQWSPDLIYFNNTTVKPTVGYYIQQAFGQHAGDTYLFSELKLSNHDEAVNKRVGKSIVRDAKSGDIIVKLVNLLPVEIDLDLSTIGVANQQVNATVISGKPTDQTAKPVAATFQLDRCKLSPYSFTVFRIPAKK